MAVSPLANSTVAQQPFLLHTSTILPITFVFTGSLPSRLAATTAKGFAFFADSFAPYTSPGFASPVGGCAIAMDTQITHKIAKKYCFMIVVIFWLNCKFTF